MPSAAARRRRAGRPSSPSGGPGRPAAGGRTGRFTADDLNDLLTRIDLTELAGRQDQAWHEATELIGRRTATDYDAAAALLADLGEVCRRQGSSETFTDRVAQLRLEQRRKISFLQRLVRLGVV